MPDAGIPPRGHDTGGLEVRRASPTTPPPDCPGWRMAAPASA
jgi:hypothetical protein